MYIIINVSTFNSSHVYWSWIIVSYFFSAGFDNCVQITRIVIIIRITEFYLPCVSLIPYINNRTHAWYVIVWTDAFLEQSIANFPCKYRWTFAFVLRYLRHHFGCSHSGLWATDCSRSDRTSLIIPVNIRHNRG